MRLHLHLVQCILGMLYDLQGETQLKKYGLVWTLLTSKEPRGGIEGIKSVRGIGPRPEGTWMPSFTRSFSVVRVMTLRGTKWPAKRWRICGD